MSAIIEAIEAERSQLEEELEGIKGRYEDRFTALDLLKEQATEALGDRIMKPDPPKRARSGKKPGPKPQPGGTELRKERKAQILRCITENHPEFVRSKIIRESLGFSDKNYVRGLLEEMLADGILQVAGRAAGTKYGLVEGGDRQEPAEQVIADADLDKEVYDFLRAAGEPKAILGISLATEIPNDRIRGAVARLKGAGRIHLVRGDNGVERFEPTHDGRGRIE